MTTQAGVSTVGALEPAIVWRLFAGIAATPHPSKHEARIRQHVRGIAEQAGLAVREDHVGNIVIDVPASAGCEEAPIVVLQGHLDMVPEKNTDLDHDFERDPIRLVVDKEPDSGKVIVRADGTTLGADNGIGVAMALAAATSPDVVHGPLELLFTVDEEAGMTGAKALTPDSFRGRRLLNLDSEDDEAIYIGCAGGCDTTLTWNLQTEPLRPADEIGLVAVTGLRGGHSGSDIHEGRGNAIKLLARLLLQADCGGLRIAQMEGGSKRNAIPREAEAIVIGPPGALGAWEAAAGEIREQAVRESAEENLAIHVEQASIDDAPRALGVADTRRLFEVIAAVPHGVLGMHPTMAGLVQTSNNLATLVANTARNGGRMRIEVGTLSRSSSASRMQEVLCQIAAIGRLADATVETANEYPGWEPNVNSPMLGACRRLYRELFGRDPDVTAIHAGLECGVIGQRVGGMDMVSLGPTIVGAHSPDERVYVTSVQKSWKYLKAVLAELACA